MWNSICNISSAIADLAVIAGKEISHQFESASEVTESVTVSLSNKAAAMRARYEADLAEREAATKPAEEVTPSEEIPA